jgi:hypothetical protein
MADIKIVDLNLGTVLGANDALVLVQGDTTLQVSGQSVAKGVKAIANLADKAYVDAIVAGAPELLDTLNELAAAIGDDPNFGSSIKTIIDSKLPTANFGFEFWNALAGVSTYHIDEDTNLYYTQARFDSAFTAKTTTSLAEGSNLYYTQARFDSAFTAKTTTSLAEGSNLYYTEQRVRNALSSQLTTENLNVKNIAFTGTGAVTITSGNDLNLVAAGDIFFKGQRTITLTRLKTVVAASTDFADFKARIAAL